MFLRNRIRMIFGRRPGDFRSIPTHGFYVALDPAEVNALRRLEGNERRFDFVFDNADGLWSGPDFLYIEDTWDVLHRVATRHPPTDALDWTLGEAPLRWLVASADVLVEGHAVDFTGGPGIEGAGPDTPDGEVVSLVEVGETTRVYTLGLIDPDRLRALSAALPDLDLPDFETAYRAHCPDSWPQFGPVDCARCHLLYGRTRDFLARHAGGGKSVVVATEA